MFKLSRITSKPASKGEHTIIMVGYDNGELVKKKVQFKDYFYITESFPSNKIMEYDFYPQTDVKYKTMDGKTCYKTYYKSIYDVNNARNDADVKYEIYSSDIKPEQKFILDNNIEWDIDNRNFAFYDIETDVNMRDKAANMPERAEMPVTSIQLYINSKQAYYTISWHPDLDLNGEMVKLEEKDNYNIIYCDCEETMLKFFIEFVKNENIDMLVGWYSEQYDLPYIINRCRLLEIDIESISPTKNIFCSNKDFNKEAEDTGAKRRWINYIHGLDHLDMMDLLRNMNIQLSDDKLDTAAKEILNDGENEHIRKIKNVTWRDWKDDYEGFLKYGIRDVEILVEINKKRKILSTFIILQEITNIPRLKDLDSKTSIVENMLFKLFWRDRIVFPNKHFYVKQPYKGAFVLDPPFPGLHHNVAVLDYASLYPTTIMWANLSNETFIISHTQAVEKGLDIDRDIIPKLNKKGIKFVDTGYDDELNGKRYLFLAQESKQGLFAQLERYMYTQRKAIKKEMRGVDPSDPEYQVLDTRQYIYKIVLNSAYGAFGSATYRFYKPEIADTITFFARKSILAAREYFKDKFNMETLYIDTDSLFLSLGEYDDGFLEKETDLFTNEYLMNNVILKHNNGFNKDYMFMELEHEKTLTHIYLGTSKKRYYSIQKNGKKYIRGINIIRKDTPLFMRDALGELVEKCVRETINLSDVLKIEDSLKLAQYKDLGVYKRFTKEFDQYPAGYQHVRSTIWANELFNLGITPRDVVLLIYIKNKCEDHLKPKDRHSVICLPEDKVDIIKDHNQLMEIDYGTYMDKQIIKQLEEFELIPLVKYIIDEYKNIRPEYYPPKAPKVPCPVCGKTHAKRATAETCRNKLAEKIDKLYLKNIKNIDIKTLEDALIKSDEFIGLFPTTC